MKTNKHYLLILSTILIVINYVSHSLEYKRHNEIEILFNNIQYNQIESIINDLDNKAIDYSVMIHSKSVIEVNNKIIGFKTLSINDRNKDIQNLKMIEGRCFNSYDIDYPANDIMISKEKAIELFGNAQCVGYKIEVDLTEYNIIGVYDNPSYYDMIKVDKICASHYVDSIIITVSNEIFVDYERRLESVIGLLVDGNAEYTIVNYIKSSKYVTELFTLILVMLSLALLFNLINRNIKYLSYIVHKVKNDMKIDYLSDILLRNKISILKGSCFILGWIVMLYYTILEFNLLIGDSLFIVDFERVFVNGFNDFISKILSGWSILLLSHQSAFFKSRFLLSFSLILLNIDLLYLVINSIHDKRCFKDFFFKYIMIRFLVSLVNLSNNTIILSMKLDVIVGVCLILYFASELKCWRVQNV